MKIKTIKNSETQQCVSEGSSRCAALINALQERFDGNLTVEITDDWYFTVRLPLSGIPEFSCGLHLVITHMHSIKTAAFQASSDLWRKRVVYQKSH